MVEALGQAGAAKALGVSRQRVHQIVSKAGASAS
jgi:predicted DNA-binding protein (UPF0251 family)